MKKMKGVWLLAAFWIFLQAAACDTTESTNVKTSGIWAQFLVEPGPEPGQVACLAVLRVGGSLGTVVDLANGEHLSCNGVEMVEYYDPITNLHWSRALVDEAADGTYEIVFHRTDEDVSTVLVMPARPTVLSVGPDGDALLFGVDNEVTWDASDPGDEVSLKVTGDCLDAFSASGLDDDGEDVIAKEEIQPSQESCLATVEVDRVVYGEVAPEFQGGMASAENWDATTVRAMYPTP